MDFAAVIELIAEDYGVNRAIRGGGKPKKSMSMFGDASSSTAEPDSVLIFSKTNKKHHGGIKGAL